MVHTGFPSSGLCSGGSSDPFFSPLCVLCFSALSSLPPSSTSPNPRFVIPLALSPEGNVVTKGSDPVERNLLIPPLLSQRAHESKTRANNYFIFSSIQTHILTTPLESWPYNPRRGGVFHTLPPTRESQSGTDKLGCPPTFKGAQMNRGSIEP
jgi:hypothetical protein